MRHSTADRNSVYCLDGLAAVADDPFVGVRIFGGKLGRGAEGMTPL